MNGVEQPQVVKIKPSLKHNLELITSLLGDIGSIRRFLGTLIDTENLEFKFVSIFRCKLAYMRSICDEISQLTSAATGETTAPVYIPHHEVESRFLGSALRNSSKALGVAPVPNFASLASSVLNKKHLGVGGSENVFLAKDRNSVLTLGAQNGEEIKSIGNESSSGFDISKSWEWQEEPRRGIPEHMPTVVDSEKALNSHISEESQTLGSGPEFDTDSSGSHNFNTDLVLEPMIEEINRIVLQKINKLGVFSKDGQTQEIIESGLDPSQAVSREAEEAILRSYITTLNGSSPTNPGENNKKIEPSFVYSYAMDGTSSQSNISDARGTPGGDENLCLKRIISQKSEKPQSGHRTLKKTKNRTESLLTDAGTQPGRKTHPIVQNLEQKVKEIVYKCFSLPTVQNPQKSLKKPTSAPLMPSKTPPFAHSDIPHLAITKDLKCEVSTTTQKIAENLTGDDHYSAIAYKDEENFLALQVFKGYSVFEDSQFLEGFETNVFLEGYYDLVYADNAYFVYDDNNNCLLRKEIAGKGALEPFFDFKGSREYGQTIRVGCDQRHLVLNQDDEKLVVLCLLTKKLVFIEKIAGGKISDFQVLSRNRVALMTCDGWLMIFRYDLKEGSSRMNKILKIELDGVGDKFTLKLAVCPKSEVFAILTVKENSKASKLICYTLRNGQIQFLDCLSLPENESELDCFLAFSFYGYYRGHLLLTAVTHSEEVSQILTFDLFKGKLGEVKALRKVAEASKCRRLVRLRDSFVSLDVRARLVTIRYASQKF